MKIPFNSADKAQDSPGRMTTRGSYRTAVCLIVLFLAIPVSQSRGHAAETDLATWESSLSVSLNLTRGNSETSLVAAAVESHRKASGSDLRLKAEMNYGTAEVEKSDGTKDEEINVQNTQGSAMYRHLLSRRSYAYLNLNALQDEIADIDYRVVLGGGGGYYLIRSETLEFSIEGGPSYIAEEVDGNRDGVFALRAAERLDYQMAEKSRLWETVEYLVSLRDTRDYLLNAEIGAEAALTTTLALRATLQAKYDNTPASGNEEVDLVLTSGVSYRF